MPRQYTPKVQCTCAYCGKEFERAPSLIEGETFCSAACYHAMPRTLAPRAKKTPETFRCMGCGREAIKTDKRGGRYCSRACYRKRPSNERPVPWAHCGCDFLTRDSDLAYGRAYCSWRCAVAGKVKAQPTTCAYCGTSFAVRPNKLQSGRGRYCSRRCKGLAMRTANFSARSSGAYNSWRNAVYRRDNYTCQRCGARGVRINAHHRKSFARYPHLRLDVANGETLCETCHNLWHHEYGK